MAATLHYLKAVAEDLGVAAAKADGKAAVARDEGDADG